MDKNTGFRYTYSATINQEVQEIRKKYMPKEESKIEELRRLDYEVQTAGIIPALVLGIMGFLLFGLGVCMTIQVISGGILPGVFLGIVGGVAMLAAYPVHRARLGKVKEKLVPRILELTSELAGVEVN
ncbi:MAG: hypothetical protein J6J38_06890 [Lachnospiraceae bacterium]|nr:hypothetical protein [Lachnospiraceae bacterium]